MLIKGNNDNIESLQPKTRKKTYVESPKNQHSFLWFLHPKTTKQNATILQEKETKTTIKTGKETGKKNVFELPKN